MRGETGVGSRYLGVVEEGVEGLGVGRVVRWLNGVGWGGERADAYVDVVLPGEDGLHDVDLGLG